MMLSLFTSFACALVAMNLGKVHCGVRFSESRYIDCNYSLLNAFIIMIDYMRYIRISRVAGE